MASLLRSEAKSLVTTLLRNNEIPTIPFPHPKSNKEPGFSIALIDALILKNYKSHRYKQLYSAQMG